MSIYQQIASEFRRISSLLMAVYFTETRMLCKDRDVIFIAVRGKYVKIGQWMVFYEDPKEKYAQIYILGYIYIFRLSHSFYSLFTLSANVQKIHLSELRLFFPFPSFALSLLPSFFFPVLLAFFSCLFSLKVYFRFLRIHSNNCAQIDLIARPAVRTQTN